MLVVFLNGISMRYMIFFDFIHLINSNDGNHSRDDNNNDINKK